MNSSLSACVESVPLEAIASIAATLLSQSAMNAHDAVIRAYELLEIAAAGKEGSQPLPQSYLFGIEAHRQMMIQAETKSVSGYPMEAVQSVEGQPNLQLVAVG